MLKASDCVSSPSSERIHPQETKANLIMSIQTNAIQQSLLQVTAASWGLRAPRFTRVQTVQRKVVSVAALLGFSISY